MSAASYPLGESAAAKISAYLLTGKRHDTPKGRAAIVEIIRRELPHQLWSLLMDVRDELRGSLIDEPEDHHCMSAKRRRAQRLLDKLNTLLS